MSLICGIYYGNGKPVTPEISSAMMEQAGIYHSDASGQWCDKSIFLGCHSQYVTPESIGEILPLHDYMLGLTIVSDAIIDNREELLNQFDIAHSDRTKLSDSRLIMLAYREWGRDCPKYLLGDFSFVIWDENQQQLFCAVDHRGTRSLYYYWRDPGVFAFCTLLKPLLVVPEIGKEHNKTWFADFLAMPMVGHQLDPTLTLYQDILLLPAGHSLTVSADRLDKQVYWQVKEQAELKLKSNAEYAEALREVLGKAVSDCMRSIRPPGVMLSGGLDSTAVACMAARELARDGRDLNAFSLVPMTGFRNYLQKYILADETPYIEAVKEYAGNIKVTYDHFDDRHSLSDTDRLMAILEQPYKVFENLFWVEGILSTAKKQNVGIILQGGAGNVTISWGDTEQCLLTFLRSGRWRSLLELCCQRIRCFPRRYRPKVLFYLFNSLMPNHGKSDAAQIADTNNLSPINPDFARRVSVEERFHQFGYDPHNYRFDAWEERSNWLCLRTFSHLGTISTKISLAHKVTVRDPTLDKRVIEFCLSVPPEQYLHGGVERSLIRSAMIGLMPNKVRLNANVRGTQTADVAQRLQPQWPEIVDEIEKIGERVAEREYLDIQRIRSELGKYRTLSDDAINKTGWRMLIRSLIFSRYLRSEKFD